MPEAEPPVAYGGGDRMDGGGGGVGADLLNMFGELLRYVKYVSTKVCVLKFSRRRHNFGQYSLTLHLD